jgi:hypothetical protein
MNNIKFLQNTRNINMHTNNLINNSKYCLKICNIIKTSDGKLVYKNDNGSRDWKKTGEYNINSGFKFF